MLESVFAPCSDYGVSSREVLRFEHLCAGLQIEGLRVLRSRPFR